MLAWKLSHRQRVLLTPSAPWYIPATVMTRTALPRSPASRRTRRSRRRTGPVRRRRSRPPQPGQIGAAARRGVIGRVRHTRLASEVSCPGPPVRLRRPDDVRPRPARSSRSAVRSSSIGYTSACARSAIPSSNGALSDGRRQDRRLRSCHRHRNTSGSMPSSSAFSLASTAESPCNRRELRGRVRLPAGSRRTRRPRRSPIRRCAVARRSHRPEPRAFRHRASSARRVDPAPRPRV